jgi:hypothetical protein
LKATWHKDFQTITAKHYVYIKYVYPLNPRRRGT